MTQQPQIQMKLESVTLLSRMLSYKVGEEVCRLSDGVLTKVAHIDMTQDGCAVLCEDGHAEYLRNCPLAIHMVPEKPPLVQVAPAGALQGGFKVVK